MLIKNVYLHVGFCGNNCPRILRECYYLLQICNAERCSKEIVQVLNAIDSTITEKTNMSHSIGNLNEYKRLEAFFEVHMTEGLYLLQVKKEKSTKNPPGFDNTVMPSV